MNNRSIERAYTAAGLLSLVLFFKWGCLSLPAFADEINYLNGSLTVYNNNLNSFVNFWAYKPPLFYFIPAVLYKVFGYSLAISRLPVLFYSFVTLYFTFLLGERIYNRRIGFWASILLFFSPCFFTQSGLFYSDILVAALSVSTIYFYFKGDVIKYIVSAGLLVLTKEIGVLVIGGIAVYQFFCGASRIKGTMVILSPLLFFIGWMVINKLVLGWFLYPLWSSLIGSYRFHPDLLSFLLKSAFWTNGRFIITGIILAAVMSIPFMMNLKNEVFKKETKLFFILMLLGVAGLGGLVNSDYGYTPRYLLFLQPLLFIVATGCIFHFSKNRIVPIVVCGIIVCFFILSWQSTEDYWYDLNMTYVDVVNNHQQAVQFVIEHFPSATIVTAFPFVEHLTRPALGYVSEPLPAVGTEKLFTKARKGGVLITSKNYDQWTRRGICMEQLADQIHPDLVAKYTSQHEEISIYTFKPNAVKLTSLPKACRG